MELIFWYLDKAASNVYLIAPIGILIWLMYKITEKLLPNKKYLPVPFVLLGFFGFFAVQAFPGYHYQYKIGQEKINFPHVKAHVLSWRGAFYNPLTLIWSQPTGYALVRPTEANFLVGHNEYKFGADENTFLVKVSTFDYEKNKDSEVSFEYKASCTEKLHSISGPDESGVIKWLKFNEPMGLLDFKIYCESDYTNELEVLKCMRKKLEKKSTEVTNSDIIQAGQYCSSEV